MPKTRLDFWEPKLAGNTERDQTNADALERKGWTVLTIWECETQDEQLLECLADVIRAPVVGDCETDRRTRADRRLAI